MDGKRAAAAFALLVLTLSICFGIMYQPIGEPVQDPVQEIKLEALPAPCPYSLFDAGSCDEVAIHRTVAQLIITQDLMVANGTQDSLEYDGLTKLRQVDAHTGLASRINRWVFQQ